MDRGSMIGLGCRVELTAKWYSRKVGEKGLVIEEFDTGILVRWDDLCEGEKDTSFFDYYHKRDFLIECK